MKKVLIISASGNIASKVIDMVEIKLLKSRITFFF